MCGREWGLWEYGRLTPELGYAGDCDPVGETRQTYFLNDQREAFISGETA